MLPTSSQAETGRERPPYFRETAPLPREAVTTKARNAVENLVTINDRLIQAATEGPLGAVQELLEQGANPNYFDAGWTPLRRAIVGDHTDIASLLFENGANPNQPDSWGVTDLMMAVGRRNADMVQLLLENGADPNAEDLTHRTALGLAEWLGFEDMVKILAPFTSRTEQKN
ncbi:ankyrin repeat domain-containing protein [Candidatus Peregrinibacteria bacterium]|nr:ankyrin repeat domain-containing protein [Candidatus Peregrinibacteria bacterium]